MLLERHFKENNEAAWYSFDADSEADPQFYKSTKLGNLGRSLMLLFMQQIYNEEYKNENSVRRKGHTRRT